MTDNITPLFGGDNEAPKSPIVKNPNGPRSYNIHMKSGNVIENQLGYLSINGLFVVLTDAANDAFQINFYALLEDVDYIIESDEVVESQMATETI